MFCPKCKSERITTFDTLSDHGRNIKRRVRKCQNPRCGHKFRTIELEETELSQKYEAKTKI